MTYQPPQPPQQPPPPGGPWQTGTAPLSPPPRRHTALIVIAVVVAVLVVAGGVFGAVRAASALRHSASGGSTNPAATGTTAASASGPCRYTATPDYPAPTGKTVGLPPDPNPTPKTGTVTVTLHTNFGDIPVTLNRAEAPCTVQSFLHLADSKFFDNTTCHRETAYDTLKVLQCGDPTGTGTGGPGYTIPDEFPKNLRPAPATSGQPQASIYPRGVIAMANTGQPNTGGSQFFLVYGDSQLQPNYTVFGTINPSGLTTLDTIAANGITPGTDPSTGQTTDQDGAPKQKVTIQTATAP